MNKYRLVTSGPYAADKAAFHLLIKLEKSKIKVPYERHFLLLRLCTSVFIKIRCYTELIFNKYSSDWDKMRTFSTPKLLRFVEILEKFTPPEQKESGNVSQAGKNDELKKLEDSKTCGEIKSCKGSSYTNEESSPKEDSKSFKGDFKSFSEDSKSPKEDSTNSKEDSKDSQMDKMLKDIDQCDFATLGDQIEDKLNSFKANLKDLEVETEVRVEKEENVSKIKI